MVVFQGESGDGLLGPPGRQGEPGDRVGQTRSGFVKMGDAMIINPVFAEY